MSEKKLDSLGKATLDVLVAMWLGWTAVVLVTVALF